MKKCGIGCRQTKDKIGILFAQLGTPDAPTKEALYPYLKQFLGDPRVIEKNRVLWWFILNCLVLPTRPKRSAALYKRIWTEKGSPLRVITEAQLAGVQKEFEGIEEIEFEYGMRYGTPSLETAIDKLIDAGCSKILLFNLYPQYSATTTASNYDVVFKHLLKRRVVPTLRVAEPYYAHPEYIEALAATINDSLSTLDQEPEYLVLSYHGIPEEYITKGDPYCCMCTETTQAMLPLLDIAADKVIHTYQSRFGKDPWLVPYSDETIEALAKKGVKHIAVACPGFTTDCLETLDEMGNEAREEFTEHGGKRLDLVPCLNDHPVWISGMASLIRSEISSWLTTAERMRSKNSVVSCPVRLAKKAANG